MKHFFTGSDPDNRGVLRSVLMVGLSCLIFLGGIPSSEADTRLFEHSWMKASEFIKRHPDTQLFSDLIEDSQTMRDLVDREKTTVFVPTDEAFMRLSPQMRNRLNTDKTFRQYVLDYHTLEGRYFSGHMHTLRRLQSTARDSIDVQARFGWDIWVNGHKVVQKDIDTRNGIVHLIDGVLLPPDDNRLPSRLGPTSPSQIDRRPRPQVGEEEVYNREIDEILEKANDQTARMNLRGLLNHFDSLSTFAELTQSVNLDRILEQDSGQMTTLFVPTNQAFEKLDPQLRRVIEEYPLFALEVLMSHIVPGRVREDHIGIRYEGVYTIDGQLLRMEQLNTPLVENARVLVPNLEATNGMIHVIDRVLTIER